LWQDFAIYSQRRSGAVSPNIVHNEGRELTSDENPFDPPPDFPTSSRDPDAIQPIGIEFGHINLRKKVFDLFGLPL